MFYLRYLRLRERPDPEDAPERLRERVDLLEARLEQEVGQEARLEQLEQRLRDLENNSRQEDSSHRNQLSSKVFTDLFCTVGRQHLQPTLLCYIMRIILVAYPANQRLA